MAVAFDATANHSGSGVSTTGTITISTVNLVIGQAVILFIVGNDASVTFTVTSVVDSGGTNKYVKLTSVVNSIRSFMECWVCKSVTATVTTGSFTVTWSSTGPANSAASYAQYSGMLELGGYLAGTQASTTALTQTKVTQGANSMIVCGFGNQGLGTHTAGTATNLRVSNTTAGTATTAEGIASCDSTNTTAASGTSLAVAQTLGTAGISSNIILELSPNFTWVGDSETVDDVPSFNITLKQGFNTPSTILEPDLGDVPDAWPIVPAAIFLAPMYSDTVTNEELPGFDTTKSRGFLSLAIAEMNLGDNVELPPSVFAIGQTTLMGYRGYRVSQCILATDQDYGPDRLPVVTTVFNDWTTDAENQRPWWMNVIEDDVLEPEADRVPDLVSWTDTILMGWRGYRTSPSLMIQSDDGIELTQAVVVIYNDLTTDAENQWSWTNLIEDDSSDTVELPQIALTTGWDTDAEQQMSRAVQFSYDDVLDAGVERISIALTTGWDTDAEQQRAMPLGFSSDTLADETVERVQIALTTGWDTDAEQQRSMPLPFSSDNVADAAVEQITLPYNDFSTDADAQMDRSWRFGADQGLDEQVERIQIALTTGWDTDAENQTAQPNYFRDVLADEGVELIQLNPLVAQLYAWDSDGEAQLDRSWHAGDDVADSSVEYITLPFLDWTEPDQYAAPPGVRDVGVEDIFLITTPLAYDLDGENQIRQSDWTVDRAALDDAVERISIALTTGWDTDAEYQRPIAPSFSADTVADENVERIQIALTTGWDTDGEYQLDRSWRIGDDLSDAGVEYITLPFEDWSELPQQIVTAAIRDFASEDVLLTTTPLAYDLDLESQLWQYAWTPDRALSDDAVERIVLPANEWDTDADEQLPMLPYVGLPSDGGADWTQFIIIPVVVPQLYAWDSDAEQQTDRSWRVGDDVADAGVEYITLPPEDWSEAAQYAPLFAVRDSAVEDTFLVTTPLAYDLDLENQVRQMNWTVDRTLSDETVERITLNAGVAVALDDLMSAYPAGRFGYTPFAAADEGALQFLNAISRLLISQYEAKATVAAVVQYGNYEGLARLSKTLATNYEGVAALARALASNYESLATLRRQLLSEYEAFKGLTATKVNQYEAKAAIAALRRANYEALASVTESLLSQYEALGFTTITQTLLSQYEALLGATATLKSQYEAEQTFTIAKGSNYEALVPLLVDYLSNYECTGFRAGVVFPIMSRLGRSASPYACSDDSTASGTGGSSTAMPSATSKTDACSEDSASGTKSVDSDSNTCPD